MKNSDFIVFDFETGGLSPEKNPALEIALITLDGKTLKEKDRWETFIKPYDNLEITQGALNANGLKASDFNNGIEKRDLMESLKKIFLKYNKSNAIMRRPIMVGHNVAFDLGFLEYIFKDDKKGLYHYISRISVDTFLEALRAFPNETSHKLGTVCELLGVELIDAHKAMNDTVATAEVFKILTKRMRNSKGGTDSDSKKESAQIQTRKYYQF